MYERISMYERIYVPVDNSAHSDSAARLSIALAERTGATIVGSHVYAAKLHDVRFMQMEFTLPDEYKEENELEKQRRIHDSLITRGLQLISDSYLDGWGIEAESAGVPFERRLVDGRNFEGVCNDLDELQAENKGCDIVFLGALGTGAVKHSTVGTVTERLLRRRAIDTFIIRDPECDKLLGDGAIVVAFDGSPHSWGALRAGCELATITSRPLELVTAIEEGDEAELLLEAHQRLARRYARDAGVRLRTAILDGPASTVVAEHLQSVGAWLVIVGRHGSDSDLSASDISASNGTNGDGGAEIGSIVDILVRSGPCHVLVVAHQTTPARATSAQQRTAVA